MVLEILVGFVPSLVVEIVIGPGIFMVFGLKALDRAVRRAPFFAV